VVDVIDLVEILVEERKERRAMEGLKLWTVLAPGEGLIEGHK
jgi:hypothetical protein